MYHEITTNQLIRSTILRVQVLVYKFRIIWYFYLAVIHPNFQVKSLMGSYNFIPSTQLRLPYLQVSSQISKGSQFSFMIQDQQLSKEESKSGEGSDYKMSRYQIGEYYLSEEVADPPSEFNIKSKSSLMQVHVEKKIKETELNDTVKCLLQARCVCPQVLLVDDDPFNNLAHEMIFTKKYSTQKCSTGDQAVKLVKERRENTVCFLLNIYFGKSVVLVI